MNTPQSGQEILIAQRKFTLEKGGEPLKGSFKIFAPKPFEDENENWYCRFELFTPFGDREAKISICRTSKEFFANPDSPQVI